MKALAVFAILYLLISSVSLAQEQRHQLVSFKKRDVYFPLIEQGCQAKIVFDSSDFAGLEVAVNDLVSDLSLIAGSGRITDKHLVIAGTMGRSRIIDSLINCGVIDRAQLEGKREKFIMQAVERPVPGIVSALIIAGSDKRGAIYGIYELSKLAGVSPWHYWADVPVERHRNIYVSPAPYSLGEPRVRYRGIFLNDEAPALASWAREKFGGFNHHFYEKVFKLMLRLRANYLWPAMWGHSFNADDPENPALADKMGIIMGTSHHEPMMRAQAEWKPFGGGTAWNYLGNEKRLQAFWRLGYRRVKDYESIVTVGMRGDGDEPMSSDLNIGLLERIVEDQRGIIEEETKKDASDIPQIWALYKEVQEYYDKGMKVPEDITLLLCDDNWGNIRRLPAVEEKARKGGYGIYYHFDYVGGPRSYKWLNTSQIGKVWEQMNLAYRYGADRLWLVNVGDLKPMEFPVSFFLDLAWDPELTGPGDLHNYTAKWAAGQFGGRFTSEITNILLTYTRLNARIKPELLNEGTYSLVNYLEFERVTREYTELAEQAVKIEAMLPEKYRDAYFQLVLHPVLACSNLYELYYTVALNGLYATQQRTGTNDLAEKARSLFLQDAEISRRFHQVAGGKWKHMMDQTHIGYTGWQEPKMNVMPHVSVLDIPEEEEAGLMIQGSSEWWPQSKDEPVLPTFYSYNKSRHYIELFSRGARSSTYSLKALSPAIVADKRGGQLSDQVRINVEVRWQLLNEGANRLYLMLTLDNKLYRIRINAIKNSSLHDFKGFIETEGALGIEASHFSRSSRADGAVWMPVQECGRDGEALTVFPGTERTFMGHASAPGLEYDFYTLSADTAIVHAYVNPSLDFLGRGGLRYAVALDDEAPQVVNINGDSTEGAWERAVARNINISVSAHPLRRAGKHVLKIWSLDPGVVFQKFVLDLGGLRPSFLGPAER